MEILPVYDRILVRPVGPEEEKSAGGIVLAAASTVTKDERGKVVAVGTGYPDGRTFKVRVGDTVIYDIRSPMTTLRIEGVDHRLMSEGIVLAVVE